jgi:hypothetical protein
LCILSSGGNGAQDPQGPPRRGLTIHSSRSRFAARLNSGVRPLTCQFRIR